MCFCTIDVYPGSEFGNILITYIIIASIVNYLVTIVIIYYSDY